MSRSCGPHYPPLLVFLSREASFWGGRGGAGNAPVAHTPEPTNQLCNSYFLLVLIVSNSPCLVISTPLSIFICNINDASVLLREQLTPSPLTYLSKSHLICLPEAKAWALNPRGGARGLVFCSFLCYGGTAGTQGFRCCRLDGRSNSIRSPSAARLRTAPLSRYISVRVIFPSFPHPREACPLFLPARAT